MRRVRNVCVAALAIAALGWSGMAQAGPFYWDTNSTTAGFGTAGGTWGTSADWNSDPTGGGGGTLTIGPTATTDALYFGNGATGLAAGSVAVSGTQNALSLAYGSGSGAVALTGGTINLAAASTITVDNAADSIASALAGAGTSLTKEGTGILTLTGANTYTGATIVNAGTLKLQRATGTTSFTSGFTVNSNATLQFDNPAGGTWNPAYGKAIPVSLNGGTLSYTAGAVSSGYGALTGAVTVNSTSAITVSATGANASPYLKSCLFLDGGLTGSAPVTITSSTNGIGVVLRNSNSTYSGTMTVNGNASKTPNQASGLAIGAFVTDCNLPNANIIVNGTMELGNAGVNGNSANGMGWGSGATTGKTFSMGALGGTGVVIANMPTASSTRIFSVGNNNGTDTFSGEIANGANDTLSFIKAGNGAQTLSGTSTYTGTTSVNLGKLLIDGSIATSSGVSVALNATLGGHGTVSAISGAGLVSPGNSAGILTAASINPTTGMSFAAELTQLGSPDYTNAGNSKNDVLHLTGALPITAALTSANVMDVYFGVGSLLPGDTFRGGAYINSNTDFVSGVASATYNYYVLGNGSGTHAFGAANYYTLAEYNPSLSVTLSTVNEAAAFAAGAQNGRVMQFQLVPEPSTLALLAAGVMGLIAYAWRKRK